ncbi:MAG TPA: hypothetical protein VGQ42_11200 [Candidatus Dormibacteraeota bacterium]|jgi:hypothetical protein|nr:hypothetical protein [Candidatus Dormibacteraeota bacterium]
MLIAGIRHLDRVRGTGWLDCPSCHEHAAQDVIDDMTFVEALRYRFSPIGHHRVLVCRRCGYRRPISPEEAQHLETSGTPIHRAVMLPFGLLGVALIAGIVGLVWWVSQSAASALADAKITLTDQTGQNAIAVSFKGPSAWNYDANADTQSIKVSDSGGRMYFVIRRATTSGSLDELLKAHFTDEVGINTTGFPEKAPAAKTASVGGKQAEWVQVSYSQGAESDQQDIYVTSHNGVGYVITYVALGSDAIKTIADLSTEVNKSIKFTDSKETPPPSPSPSPGASPTPSPSASASPTH